MGRGWPTRTHFIEHDVGNGPALIAVTTSARPFPYHDAAEVQAAHDEQQRKLRVRQENAAAEEEQRQRDADAILE